MNKIKAIAWKDTLLAFSSRSQFLFFLILPVVFTFILGGAFSGGGEDNGVPLLIVDEDGSLLSAALIAELYASNTVSPEELSASEAADSFDGQDAPALLTIPAGFEATVQSGQPVTLDLQKTFNDFNAEVADRAVSTAVATLSRPLVIGQSSVAAIDAMQAYPSDEARSAAFERNVTSARQMLEGSPQRVKVTGPSGSDGKNGYDSNAQASVGQLVTWVFIPLLGTSALFALERTRGTMRRLVVSPARKSTFLLGTISGQLGMALVQMALLVIFGVFVMNVNWGQSVPALVVMLVTFGLASVALGVTMGTFVKTGSQANNLSIAAGMTMALLGGAWFPMEIFPTGAQTVAQLLPTTWAVKGLNELVMGGGGLADILIPATILVGFAIVFFTVGVWRFRYE